MHIDEACRNLLQSPSASLLKQWEGMMLVRTAKETYYCYFTDEAVYAYPGLHGIASFLQSYQDTHLQGGPLADFNRNVTQEVLIILPGEGRAVFKPSYAEGRPVSDDGEAVAILSLLAASGLQGTHQDWLAAAGKRKSAWVPLVSDAGVEPYDVDRMKLEVTWPMADVRDGDVTARLRARRDPDKPAVAVAVCICPLPLEDGRYPALQVVYDLARHRVLDVKIVADYEGRYADLVGSFLAYCDKAGTPAAMRAQGPRSFHLYEGVARTLGIMLVLEDRVLDEMERVCEGFVRASASIMDDMIHAHGHDHEDGCRCHHDHDRKGGCRHGHGDGCHCHDHGGRED